MIWFHQKYYNKCLLQCEDVSMPSRFQVMLPDRLGMLECTTRLSISFLLPLEPSSSDSLYRYQTTYKGKKKIEKNEYCTGDAEMPKLLKQTKRCYFH